MKNENLLPRLTKMPYEDLVKKVERIRDARVDARAASENKKTRQNRPKKPAVNKLIDTMTDKEKAALIAILERGE